MVNRIKLLVCVLTFAVNSVPAQQSVKLWAGTDATRQEKWSELFVFLPEKTNTSGISVIICPGGSYYWLAMDKEGSEVAKYLNDKGIAAFVLKYRTAMHLNRHPAMIEDLQRAMQVVEENAAIYKIDPKKVGVMGFSAGGHLAGTEAEYFDHTFAPQLPMDGAQKPYFAAMIYPVVSMKDSICHKESRRNLLGDTYPPEVGRMMSLEQNVRPDMPPVFLLHCTGDRTVDPRNSIEMDKALTAKNVKHEFLLIDENGHGGHGFGIRPNGKATGWIDEFLRWLAAL